MVLSGFFDRLERQKFRLLRMVLLDYPKNWRNLFLGLLKSVNLSCNKLFLDRFFGYYCFLEGDLWNSQVFN